VAVLDEVVGAFLPARVTGEPAKAAQGREVVPSSRDQLVDVGLVPDVPDDPITGAVECTMQGESEFDHSQIGAEMASGASNLVDQKLADLLAELGEFLI
jgi:hypothetical protein